MRFEKFFMTVEYIGKFRFPAVGVIIGDSE